MGEKHFDSIISLSAPDFAQQFLEAIGAKPGDTIEVAAPQFDRTDEVTPYPPDAWERLKTLSVVTLKEIGCLPWDKPDERGTVLMLFPHEWYEHIPDGFEVENILGKAERFRRGKTSSDRRFGMLAFGVRTKAKE